MKDARYLFNLILPIVYFSYKGIIWILKKFKSKNKNKKNLKLIISLILLGVFIISVRFSDKSPAIETYISGLDAVDKQNLNNCSLMSNAWVELNYLGRVAMDFPRKELLNHSIEKGEIILMFKNVGEPDYIRDKEFIDRFSVIKETDKFILLGKKNSCNPIVKNDLPYVDKLAEVSLKIHGYKTESRPCNLLFKETILADICNLVNLR